MLEQTVDVTAGFDAGTHDETSYCQIIQLGHCAARDNSEPVDIFSYLQTYGYGPAEGVEGGGELAHGDQGLAPHRPPHRVDLENVHEVDLD